MWMGWIDSALQLKDSATEIVRLPKTGIQYLLSSRQCSLQSGQNDFQHWETRSPGYVILVTDEQDTCVSVCPASQLCVDYSTDEKRALEKTLKIEDGGGCH